MNPQREWFEKNYYETLGVSERATAKEIQKAYRKLARDLHPDKNPGDAAAEERFKEVSSAYDVLGDEAKRQEYDQVRTMGPMAGGQGGAPGGFSFNVGDMAGAGGLGDLLGNMFGRRGGGAGGSAAGVGPRRGTDIEATLTIDFADAVAGIETSLFLTADAQCTTCSGSGARPGTSPKMCTNCNGRGVVDDNQGLFAMSSPCPMCQGNGVRIEYPCDTCRGSGVEKRPREVKTRIPAGVKDGQTIKLKGRGGPGRNGGPNGDLLVELRVLPHDRFGRSGDDLTVAVSVRLDQAVLGGDVEVPTIDGSTVTLRVKPGTQPGSRQRVRGRGIRRQTRRGDVSGDLIVTVDVSIPTDVNDAQREAIEAFARASTLEGEVAQ
ncbi:MAG: molecular chaperone DnaJ [Actinomycetota bacterium]